MAELCVRGFKEEDAERASKVLLEAFRSFLGKRVEGILSKHFSPENLIKVSNVKTDFIESRIFIAEDSSNIIGLIKVTAGVNGLGVLDYIAVDPECQAHGVGALLMKKAEEFWAEHKQRKIGTGVSAHNKKALMYYLRHDFIPEGYRRDHFFEGIDEIILGRFLKM